MESWNTVIVISLFLVILAGVTMIFRWLKSYRSPQLFGKLITRINTSKKIVALTYDDGPNPPFTNAILDILKKHQVLATFFIVGKLSEKYPEIVVEIYKQGHELGNHSWNHDQLIFRSNTFVNDEIKKTDDYLRDLGYQGEIHFRAPYGYKLFSLPWILSSQKRKHILFDVVPNDWSFPGVSVIVERVLSKVRPGSIISLHDGYGERQQTVEATDEIITKLKAIGYSFVTISELIKNENS